MRDGKEKGDRRTPVGSGKLPVDGARQSQEAGPACAPVDLSARRGQNGSSLQAAEASPLFTHPTPALSQAHRLLGLELVKIYCMSWIVFLVALVYLFTVYLLLSISSSMSPFPQPPP